MGSINPPLIPHNVNMIKYDGRVILELKGKKKSSNWIKPRVSSSIHPSAESRTVTAERETGMSLGENFGTRSLRGRPRLVSAAGDGKSSRESELSAVANNARRDEGIVEFTPRGVHSPANIPSPVHSPLWNGNGAGVGGRGEVGEPHQLHGKLRSHYLCAYTPTRAAH